jgi:hypothetical protein
LFSKQKKIESRERRRDSERKFDERERERRRLVLWKCLGERRRMERNGREGN